MFSSSCFVTVVSGGCVGGWQDFVFCIGDVAYSKSDSWRMSFPQMIHTTSVTYLQGLFVCIIQINGVKLFLLPFFILLLSCVLSFFFFFFFFSLSLSLTFFTFDSVALLLRKVCRFEREKERRMQNYVMLVNMLMFSFWAYHNLQVLVNSRYLLICWYSSLSPKCVWSRKA